MHDRRFERVMIEDRGHQERRESRLALRGLLRLAPDLREQRIGARQSDDVGP
jgi:hypothetical protein